MAFLAAAVLWGCAGEGGGGPRGPVTVGDPLPAVDALTLEGDTVVLTELTGGPLLVNLWATWCAPCRAETPYLQGLHEQHEALDLVGISFDNRSAVDDIEMFVEEYGVTYTILHDPTMSAMDVFGVIGLPATFLVAPDGTVRWARMGPVDEGDPAFEQALEELLEEAG